MGKTHSQRMPKDLPKQPDYSQVIGFGPRVSSLYNVVMFEGYVIADSYYASSVDELWEILNAYWKVNRPTDPEEQEKRLAHYYLNEVVKWTTWYDEPPLDWWIKPTVKRALDMVQQWTDTNTENLWLEDISKTRNTVSADKLTEYIQTLIKVTK